MFSAFRKVASCSPSENSPSSNEHSVHNSIVDAEGSAIHRSPPPKIPKNETIEEKTLRKFKEQPLVPIGCLATAYFLASGIKSFRDRDPVKSQRMMKARVMAQFATLMCFIGYIGLEKFDWRMAPMYQDVKKAEAIMQAEAAGGQNLDAKGNKDGK